jgi:hypothetical protein
MSSRPSVQKYLCCRCICFLLALFHSSWEISLMGVREMHKCWQKPPPTVSVAFTNIQRIFNEQKASGQIYPTQFRFYRTSLWSFIFTISDQTGKRDLSMSCDGPLSWVSNNFGTEHLPCQNWQCPHGSLFQKLHPSLFTQFELEFRVTFRDLFLSTIDWIPLVLTAQHRN